MPLLVTFQGRPVKRRRRVDDGVFLRFVSAVPGEQGDAVVVSQEEWFRYGKVQYLPRDQMRNVREVARQFPSSTSF